MPKTRMVETAPGPGLDGEDRRFLGIALEQARSIPFSVRPNPSVGAALAKHGALIATGRTQPPGGHHAEIMAMLAAGPSVRGATLYVTLEPCSHFGRTPPCADAVIHSGIARVVVGATDRNPKVAGQGLSRLREAGIHVHSEDPGSDCDTYYRSYHTWVALGRPRVTLTMARDLQERRFRSAGRATASAALREWAIRLRQENDMELSARTGSWAFAPIRSSGKPGGVSGLGDLAGGPGTTFPAALRALAANGCHGLLVEALPESLPPFLASGEWDSLYLFGKAGAAWDRAQGPPDGGASQGMDAEFVGRRKMGEDIVYEYARPKPGRKDG